MFALEKNAVIKNYVFAIFFIESGLINLILSIIDYGLRIDDTVAEGIRYVFYAIVFFVVFLAFIIKVKTMRYTIKTKAVLIFILCIFIFPEVYNCLVNNFNSESIVLFIRFIVFVLPCYFIAVSIFEKSSKIDIDFIRGYKWIAVLLTPFFIYYFIRMTFPVDPIKNYSDFGYLNYMSMAYFILPIFLGAMIEFLLLAKTRIDKIFSAYGSVISLICIICTGTRGVIIVTICASLLVLLYSLIYTRKSAKKVLVFTVFVILINLFAQYIWQPTGSRLGKQFINDAKYATLAEEYQEAGFLMEINARENRSPAFNKAQDIIYRYAVNNDKAYEKSVEEALLYIERGDIEHIYSGNISKDVLNELVSLEKEDMTVLSRMPLMKMAWLEFDKSKAFGHGCYYYINKYGTYPHNAILELLCDTGIVGTCIFVFGIIYILFAIRRHLKLNFIAAIIIFALSYTPSYMLSGSVYMDVMIILFITFGVMILCSCRGEKHIEQ